MLRGGASDADLDQALTLALLNKPERHEFNERPEKTVRFMSMTGG
jgi:cyclic pyranopterin phosphate synthase